MSFYQEKADFHFKQYQIAIDSGKEKAAAKHQQEYLNYLKFIEIEKRNQGV